MQTRTHSNPAPFSHGASARRRIRRSAGSQSLYCRTNGCTTYLEVVAGGRSAHCPICGASRTIA